MLVDDTTHVLLALSFVLLTVTLLQLIGWIKGHYTFLTFSAFLTAVALEWWNLNAAFVNGSVAQYAFSYLFMGVGTAMVYIAAETLNGLWLMVLGVFVFIVSMLWGYQKATTWIQDTTGWDLSFLEYLVAITVVALMIVGLFFFAFDRKWLRRVLKAVFISLICALSVQVIYRCDPTSGFDVVQFEVFQFDTNFLVLWAMTWIIYETLYWFSYRNIGLHPDREHDEREALWKQHRKEEKGKKKKKKQDTGGITHSELQSLVDSRNQFEAKLAADQIEAVLHPHRHHHHHHPTPLSDSPDIHKLLYPDLSVT